MGAKVAAWALESRRRWPVGVFWRARKSRQRRQGCVCGPAHGYVYSVLPRRAPMMNLFVDLRTHCHDGTGRLHDFIPPYGNRAIDARSETEPDVWSKSLRQAISWFRGFGGR